MVDQPLGLFGLPFKKVVQEIYHLEIVLREEMSKYFLTKMPLQKQLPLKEKKFPSNIRLETYWKSVNMILLFGNCILFRSNVNSTTKNISNNWSGMPIWVEFQRMLDSKANHFMRWKIIVLLALKTDSFKFWS